MRERDDMSSDDTDREAKKEEGLYQPKFDIVEREIEVVSVKVWISQLHQMIVFLIYLL